MAQQNIYDNEIFFAGYKKIRENQVNANNLFEIPALFSMMPNLKDKTILDLGCGFGEHCKGFVESGAKKVIGIDISEKMLEIAKQENADSKITYINMPMENIFELTEKFDIVISSLAFHYVEDFAGVVKNVFNLLNENGTFIFSQENFMWFYVVFGAFWAEREGRPNCSGQEEISHQGRRNRYTPAQRACCNFRDRVQRSS